MPGKKSFDKRFDNNLSILWEHFSKSKRNREITFRKFDDAITKFKDSGDYDLAGFFSGLKQAFVEEGEMTEASEVAK